MLTLEIGGCTVGELMNRMGSEEFTRWRGFHRLQPFGDVRRDTQAGIVASAIYATHGERSSPSDFVLKFKRPKSKGVRKRADPGVLAAFRAKKNADIRNAMLNKKGT
jgi:Protein of unknown function (DUF4035)